MIRWLALCFLPLPVWAQAKLAACVAVTKDYVVGAKLPPSGLFLRIGGSWRHAGYNHPFVVGVDYDRKDSSALYLAAGNGLFRVRENGGQWTLLTGSDVTELRDLAVDPEDGATIYFAHSHGLRVTHDRGEHWRELAGPLHRKYVEAVRIDRSNTRRLLIGGEEGVFRSEDGGLTWKIAGAAGYGVLRIEQSPHDSCYWLAATELGGLFASRDCGKTFENSGRIGAGRNLYSIAFDPTNAGRIALGGWGPGVAISEDGGRSWQERNAGLPRPDIWSAVFDPAHSGRIYASVEAEALYVSEDAGKNWKRDGLEDSAAHCLKFIP